MFTEQKIETYSEEDIALNRKQAVYNFRNMSEASRCRMTLFYQNSHVCAIGMVARDILDLPEGTSDYYAVVAGALGIDFSNGLQGAADENGVPTIKMGLVDVITTMNDERKYEDDTEPDFEYVMPSEEYKYSWKDIGDRLAREWDIG